MYENPTKSKAAIYLSPYTSALLLPLIRYCRISSSVWFLITPFSYFSRLTGVTYSLKIFITTLLRISFGPVVNNNKNAFICFPAVHTGPFYYQNFLLSPGFYFRASGFGLRYCVFFFSLRILRIPITMTMRDTIYEYSGITLRK